MSTTQDSSERQPFRLPDLRVGNPDDPDPLEGWTWEDLRDVIYDDDSCTVAGAQRAARA